MMTSEKARENRLRRLADRWGYSLRKDRARMLGLHHRGEYMLVNLDHGGADLGWDYDASLDDVEAFLTKEDATLRG